MDHVFSEPERDPKGELFAAEIQLLRVEVAGELGAGPVPAKLTEDKPPLSRVDAFTDADLESGADVGPWRQAAILEGRGEDRRSSRA